MVRIVAIVAVTVALFSPAVESAGNRRAQDLTRSLNLKPLLLKRPLRLAASLASRAEVLPDAARIDHIFVKENTSIAAGNGLQASSGGKPIRGVDRIVPGREKKKIKYERGDRKCGVTVAVDSASHKYQLCPMECPYSVQDTTDNMHCTFRCVAASECVAYNPSSPVADHELSVCRPPSVDGCTTGKLDGTDSCDKCQNFFTLGGDGKCYFNYRWLISCLVALLLALLVVIIVWYIDLELRPVTSERGLVHGLHYRTRSKVHMPRVPGSARELWPLTTNLTKEQVAGPGFVLHMTFQFRVIIWAALVGLIWVLMVLLVDTELFQLGTRKFETPRDRCILIAWGYETQQRLMWTKITFLVVIYIFTFICCIYHSVQQLRHFETMDKETRTMKDFAAMCIGMPILDGKVRVEELLKQAGDREFGSSVVGVSVCWNYGEDPTVAEDLVGQLVDDEDVLAAHARCTGLGRSEEGLPADASEHSGFLRKRLHAFESSKLVEDAEDLERPARVRNALDSMKCSDRAFIIFDSEVKRDAAVEKVKNQGFQFMGSAVCLEAVEHEPESCLFQSFDTSDHLEKCVRLVKGFGLIFVALVIWAVVFYGPYAWSLFAFNYDGGKEPGFVYSLAFSMVVCIGNAIMYYICGMVSENVGYRWVSQREQCYMVCYTIACSINIMVDLVTTYYMAEQVAKGLGFRLYDGTKLRDVDEFTERFESYAMQRSLAENIFLYAFPSTYLIPFLIEPVATIFVPWRLGTLLVRTHADLRGRKSEELLSAPPMDLGRYADILLNVVLAILIFYVPGGYTHTLFFSMAASHVYIYCLDHFKVLRTIPSVTYTSLSIDWCAQAMLAPCTALILSCLVFKMNGQGYGYEFEGAMLIFVCSVAFFVHCVVHMIVLSFVVPLFTTADCGADFEAFKTYKEISQRFPCSWFSANPVHCLRSKLIYKHDPPCDFFVLGKEHLLRANPAISCYYQCDKEVMEEYRASDVAASARDMARAAKDSLKEDLEQAKGSLGASLGLGRKKP